MVFKKLCVLVFWMKVASALEGLLCVTILEFFSHILLFEELSLKLSEHGGTTRHIIIIIIDI